MIYETIHEDRNNRVKKQNIVWKIDAKCNCC